MFHSCLLLRLLELGSPFPGSPFFRGEFLPFPTMPLKLKKFDPLFFLPSNDSQPNLMSFTFVRRVFLLKTNSTNALSTYPRVMLVLSSLFCLENAPAVLFVFPTVEIGSPRKQSASHRTLAPFKFRVTPSLLPYFDSHNKRVSARNPPTYSFLAIIAVNLPSSLVFSCIFSYARCR